MTGPSYDLPEIRESHQFTEAARFGKHNVVATGGWIRSEDWDGDDSGDGSTTGWFVGGDGATVVFNEGEFRGNISGGSIDIGGADASSFHVDSTGNVWMGAADYTSSPFRIDAAGNLDVGGNDATSLHMDTTGRLWVGDAVFSSAPFKVGNVGSLVAIDATITGTIKTAASGQRVEIQSTDANKVKFFTGDADETEEGRIFADVEGAAGARFGYLFIQAPTIRDTPVGGVPEAPYLSLQDESYDNTTQGAFANLVVQGEDDGVISIWNRSAGGSSYVQLNCEQGDVLLDFPSGDLRLNGDTVSFGANDSGGAGFKLLRVPN